MTQEWRPVGIRGMLLLEQTGEPVVVLADAQNAQVFCIPLSPSEAEMLLSEYEGPGSPVPSASRQLAEILEAQGLGLEHLDIDALTDDHLVARLWYSSGQSMRSLRIRAVDALIISLGNQLPLYLSAGMAELFSMQDASLLSKDVLLFKGNPAVPPN